MKYRPTPHTVFRATGDKGIALNLQTEQYYTMNEMAVRMWALLQEKDSLEAIVQVIEAEYDVSAEKVEADLDTFLRDLKLSGLIEGA